MSNQVSNLESLSKSHKKLEITGERKLIVLLESLNFIENKDFYFQYLINDLYIADFAFLDIKLVIEVDGDYHKKTRILIKDIKKDKYLYSEGWVVARLKDNQIENNPSFCRQFIKQLVDELRSDNKI